MAVLDYFLPIDDIQAPVRWTPPARSNVDVRPLIDGKATFEAMGRAVDGASTTVFFAAWVFATDSKLDEGELSSWHERLVAAARRGVEVKLLLTDFDAIFGKHHPDAWTQYAHLVRRRRGIKPPGSLDVICSLHPATVDKLLAVPWLGDRVRKQAEQIAANLNKLSWEKLKLAWGRHPRLWTILTLNPQARKVEVAASPQWVVHPASHHQKMMVVDGTIGFCGGLDITKYRNDSATARHHWHDIHLRVVGDVVFDLERNFAERWNEERVAFNAFVAEAHARKPPQVSFHTVEAPPLQWKPRPLGNPGRATAQVHRTVSVNSLLPVPTTVVDQVERGYDRAIATAANYIYIENQYFRSPRLVDRLVERAQAVTGLRLIIVLPVTPEEEPEEITLHGMHIQHQGLARLTRELGPRVGLFSLVQRARAPKAHLHGSEQVYCHSKCLIIDDVYANVGSANTGARSFRVDTECNVAFHDTSTVRRFRERLWRELLGRDSSTWPLGDMLARWNDVASKNETTKPEARSGYIVRHPLDKFQGKENILIPEGFTEIMEYQSPPARMLV